MHLRNQINVPKQANKAHSVVNQQSQHQVPLCLQCHDGSYFSLSQHSSTYTARQTTMLQAPISRSPVSANIRQAPLLLHTTEPQVSNYSRITLQNVATKPRSLTKQTRPSRLSCQRFSTVWQLNQGHRPSRFSCQCFSNVWQLNQGHRPSRFSCQCFSNVWQLNQGHRPSRFSCQCFSLQLSSPGMTPGSVAPRTVHSVRPGSTTT